MLWVEFSPERSGVGVEFVKAGLAESEVVQLEEFSELGPIGGGQIRNQLPVFSRGQQPGGPLDSEGVWTPYRARLEVREHPGDFLSPSDHLIHWEPI